MPSYLRYRPDLLLFSDSPVAPKFNGCNRTGSVTLLFCRNKASIVFSPRIASIATRALNFGLYCFLVVVIDPLLCQRLRRNLNLLRGLKSEVHYRPLPTPSSSAPPH